jgi:hypothetical protein
MAVASLVPHFSCFVSLFAFCPAILIMKLGAITAHLQRAVIALKTWRFTTVVCELPDFIALRAHVRANIFARAARSAVLAKINLSTQARSAISGKMRIAAFCHQFLSFFNF